MTPSPDTTLYGSRFRPSPGVSPLVVAEKPNGDAGRDARSRSAAVSVSALAFAPVG
jgi:hypothetical protein